MSEKTTSVGQLRDEIIKAADGIVDGVYANAPTSPETYKKTFEKRLLEMESAMKDRQHSPKEILECLNCVKRVLTKPASTGVSDAVRFGLANDLLQMFADPTEVTQIGNTCAANALVVNILLRQPSAIGKLVADSSLSGKFTVKDGSPILTPDSSIHRPGPGRPCAEQIAATMVANIVWQRETSLAGTKCKKGEIVYDPYFKEDGKTGERLVIAGKPFKGYLNPKTQAYEGGDSPNLGLSGMRAVYEQICDRRAPEPLLLCWGTPKSAGMYLYYSSPGDLESKLAELKKKPHGFPLMTSVDIRNEPFAKDYGYGKFPSNASHAVNVIDYEYDPKTKQGYVWVDNTWSKSKDHSGKKNESARIPIQQFYDACREFREKKNPK